MTVDAKRAFGWLFFFLLLFLAVIAQNTEVVTLKAFFWTLTMSRIVLLSVALLVGALIGILLARPWRRRKKTKRESIGPAGKETDAE